MVNKEHELNRLRSTLVSRGMDEETANKVVAKAASVIEQALQQKVQEAMDQAIAAGVEKRSIDFINQLSENPFEPGIITSNNQTDFTEPPFPMLPRLLNNAKPMKDGSGVYKVIPVGGKSDKPTIANNIFDAQKAVTAERLESAKKQYNKIAPQGAPKFRTATSKQDSNTQWVMPEKEKDFTWDLVEINDNLQKEVDNIILWTIKEYEDFV